MQTNSTTETCGIPGCQRRSAHMGMCHGHYRQWLKAKSPDAFREFVPKRSDSHRQEALKNPVFKTVPRERLGTSRKQWSEGLTEGICRDCKGTFPIEQFHQCTFYDKSGKIYSYRLKRCSTCHKAAKYLQSKIQNAKRRGIKHTRHGVYEIPVCLQCKQVELPNARRMYCDKCMRKRRQAGQNRNRLNQLIRYRGYKKIAVSKRGGRCERCGFQTDVFGAYHFHHRKPEEKSRELPQIKEWDHYWAEIQKCDLLCANCHAIIHWEMDQAMAKDRAIKRTKPSDTRQMPLPSIL